MKNKYNIIICLIVIVIVGIVTYMLISNKTIKMEPTLSFNKKTIVLTVGSKEKLNPIVTNLDNYHLIYESMNNNVAIVNNDEIIALAKGNTTIKVKLDGYNIEDSINVIVNDIEINMIKLSDKELNLLVDDTYKLTYTYEPLNATNKNINWEISNEEIINFNNGEIKAIKSGETLVTIKTDNNLRDTCKIFVKDKVIPVESIEIDKDNYELIVDEEKKINVIIKPENATNKEISYTTSDSSIVTIDNGVIKGIKEGNAKIIIKSDNLEKEINIVVKKKPVILNVASINLGAYHCGTSSTNCKATPKSFANLFKQYKINIVGTQESEPKSKTLQIPELSNLKYYYYEQPASSNTILSSYKFISKTKYKLPSCGERRILQKVVIKVNDVNISFYNSHFSYQSACHDKHFKAVADILAKDSNPSIMVGDLNISARSYFEKYFEPIGFEIAAYDSSTNNLHKNVTYCNSIYIKGNGHIKIKDGHHIDTFGKYTDHNMTFASLEIS